VGLGMAARLDEETHPREPFPPEGSQAPVDAGSVELDDPDLTPATIFYLVTGHLMGTATDDVRGQCTTRRGARLAFQLPGLNRTNAAS
jgi:hypothetical protein